MRSTQSGLLNRDYTSNKSRVSTNTRRNKFTPGEYVRFTKKQITTNQPVKETSLNSVLNNTSKTPHYHVDMTEFSNTVSTLTEESKEGKTLRFGKIFTGDVSSLPNDTKFEKMTVSPKQKVEFYIPDWDTTTKTQKHFLHD